MNRQPAEALAHPDARIDQVLEALRTAAAPTGLEQRVAARLAQAAEAGQTSATQARVLTKSRFAVILSGARSGVPSGRSLPVGVDSAQSKDPRILLAPARLYPIAAALTGLLIISTIAILHHRTPTTIVNTTAARSTTIASTTPTALTPASSPSLEGAGLQSRRNAPTMRAALAAGGISHPHPTSNTDPDTLALAETLAPSHPAPPLPLTAQEHLLLTATQRGAPIELAELDLAREPLLRAAAVAREKSGLQQFVRSLVSELVTSESLDPTPHSDAQPTSAPDPTSSSSTNEPPTNGASPQ